MALEPGHTLSNGHYRIQRLLGRGGFGFVYLAQDTLQGEKVAIKELIPALVGDPGMLKRFLIEARATMRLTHKRIVRTHNSFSEDGNYYIVMEYVPGGSLEERLQEQGPLPVDEAVRVAAEVCEGLACAHEVGVVHCDLKPHNILFDAEGGAKVADFGIAHVSGEMFTRSWHTRTGSFMGTLHYMSPEQMEGVRDDPRIDVYALGAVLYRMLTGQTYLEFDPQETPRSQFDNMQRIFEEQPLPPSTHVREIPARQEISAWLDGVMLKALAKRPEARYGDAEAMGAALRQGRPAPVATPARSTPARPGAPAKPGAPAGPGAPPGPSVRAVPSRKWHAPLPRWFWPVAGAAGVLTVVLVIAIGAVVGGGDGRETALPRPTEMAVAGVTTAAPLPPSHTPTLTTAPKAIDTPRPTATATDTPRPTDTSTPRPTDTPRPPTATDTPQPTATPAPTATPTPRLPQAGETRTRSKGGMVMIYVPAGDLIMGSDEHDDEKPIHTVYLDAFWMDRTEVTNAHYRRCVEAGACRAPTICDFGDPTYNDDSKADHPVVCVNWDDARAYCQWSGARLPTEAEWEKAARGTDGRLYPWGDSAADCNKAQYEPCGGETVPVGSKPAGASPYGALGMTGNVWEWVADWYAGDSYGYSPTRNPQGPASGSRKALRGGGWLSNWNDARAASRYDYPPAVRGYFFGFRCAVSAGE